MTRLVRVCLICLLPLVPLSSEVFAGQPYKCVGPDGKITFTDQKCTADAKPQRIWDSHLGSPAPDPDSDLAQDDSGYAAPSNAQGQRQERQRGGYACSTARHSWVQLTPCPRFIEEANRTRISHSDGTSTTIDSQDPRYVHQDALGHDAFCAQLPAADISSYDKNRMQDAADCH
jgi:hypothetical protein